MNPVAEQLRITRSIKEPFAIVEQQHRPVHSCNQENLAAGEVAHIMQCHRHHRLSEHGA